MTSHNTHSSNIDPNVIHSAAMPVALVTGAAGGLGSATVSAFVAAGWRVVASSRRPLPAQDNVSNVVGDITDPGHLQALATSAPTYQAVVLCAGTLNAHADDHPLRTLLTTDPAAITATVAVNCSAQVAVVQAISGRLSATSAMVALSSDAGVEHYPTWGVYGASKAAQDHLWGTFAAEETGEKRWYSVDPGDMNTAMYQRAFPGEDVSDRPSPHASAQAIVALVSSELPSGRYRAADLADSADLAGGPHLANSGESLTAGAAR